MPKVTCWWKKLHPTRACNTCSGSGGARFGISLMLQVLRSRQAPPRCPRSLLSKSWRPATVSLARALPCPELQRCSRYSQTYSSNRLRCLGRMRWLSLRNPRKRSMALVYLCLVAGCTVKSRSVPKRCLCCALADCVAPSKCRLGMPKFAFDPGPPPAGAVRRVLVRLHIAPKGLIRATEQQGINTGQR